MLTSLIFGLMLKLFYMYPEEGNMKYVRIIKDDHSFYIKVEPTEKSNARTTSQYLLKWFTMFGVAQN